jgi:ribosome maturation factor RimP
VIAGSGLVVEGVGVTTVGRRRLIRVVVDLPEDEVGSADLDAVAEASRRVGAALDDLDGTPQGGELLGDASYALEVSTPGVDRPLTERRHWMRARTRRVRVTLSGGGFAEGRLTDVGDGGIVLLVPGRKGGPEVERHLAWDDVVRGRVEVEFRRPADPADAGEGD